jgi:cobyrinic acid a,c-diamide synthase
VLANRVGSERHAGMLQASLKEPGHWLGALLRNPALTLTERHLGLVAATELSDAMERLDAAADALAATPLGQMSAEQLQAWAVDFPPAPRSDAGRPLQGKTIAVARDAAFCFLYAANLECLQQLGAEIVYFSPLKDAALPACDAVWLPGGYPELHAAKLTANQALRDSLRAHVALGKPVWAECGGMMVLFDVLTDKEGHTHPMWGLLPGKVVMQKRLAGLGSQQLLIDGQQLRGHTFHYSTSETPLAPYAHTTRPEGGTGGEAVYVHGPVVASYFHAWFASNPALVARLFDRGLPVSVQEPVA